MGKVKTQHKQISEANKTIMAEVQSPVNTTQYHPHPHETMKAAQWMGSKNIRLGTVPKPMLTAPKDAIVHITHCTICGSDLPMYNPDMKSAMEEGLILGHEAIGIVSEVGPEVKTLAAGDRVIILPVIACGECFYCKREEYSLCHRTNPSKEMEDLYGHRLSGIFGYSTLTGGYPGNQAEWCRVPNADIIKDGKYDPSFMFTCEDDFENIAADYAKFNNHEIPGGLKVCLTTAFGRSQSL